LARVETLIITLIAIVLLQGSGSLASGQSAHPEPIASAASGSLDSGQSAHTEPIYSAAGSNERFGEGSGAEASFNRPVLYWHSWAAHPPRVVPTCLFFLLLTVTLNELFRERIVISGTAYSGYKSFFKSFGTGFFTVIILLTFIRALFTSQIGAPLAWALWALLELSCLIGFAVSATAVGQWFCTLPICNRVVSKTRWRRVLLPVSGTLIICTLMLIPKIGILSGVGIRLILLLCILGLGACLRTRMGTIELEASGHK
jgi:hypothetical protein